MNDQYIKFFKLTKLESKYPENDNHKKYNPSFRSHTLL